MELATHQENGRLVAARVYWCTAVAWTPGREERTVRGAMHQAKRPPPRGRTHPDRRTQGGTTRETGAKHVGRSVVRLYPFTGGRDTG